MTVVFEVLGPVRMCRDGAPAAVPGTLRRSLLALLLARANEPVPVGTLLDTLWGGAGDPQRLQVQVHRLRGLLDDPGRLSFDPAGYRLRVRPGELDAERFETLLDDAGGATDPGRRVELVRAALRLWRGTPYQDVDVPDLTAETQRLAERRLLALEDLYTAELRLGRHGAVEGELAELVRLHPLRERLHGLLMTALYQGGRQADALATYRAARGRLVDELGIEPGPQLRDLEQRILAGEPLEPAARAGAPAQLPHNVSGFVGRDGELALLDRMLADGGAVLISAVAGTAGVGKTALAVCWTHRVRDRFPDGQLYVDLRGYGPGEPVAPEDALAGFLRALGMEGTAIPQDLAERAARFRTLADGKRLLVVLDNARSAEQVRPLLPGTPTCFVVVTSRDSLAGLAAREGAHRIDLDRMGAGEARRLLTELLGDRCAAEPEATDRLVEHCAHLPLALRIAAERLRERPRDRIADLVAELADEQGRLDLLDTGDPYASVRTVFSSSYHHLDPAAARLFRLLGLHPGRDIDAHALAALAGAEARTTRRLLDSLVRAHLAEQVGLGRYHLHDLLRSYATELAEAVDSAAERRAALARLCEFYVHTASRAADSIAPHELPSPGGTSPAFTGYEDAVSWLDLERDNLIRTAEVAAGAGMPAYLTQLATVLCWYLDLGWYLDDAERLYTNALAVAREHGDATGEGIALRGLGFVRLRQYRFAAATRHLEDALARHDRVDDRIYQAATLSTLGALHGLTGRTGDAVRYLRRSIELYDQLGLRLLAHRPLVNLGLLHRRQGRHEQALTCLRQAYAIAEEGHHPPGQVHAAYGLAGLYRDTGQYAEAFDYARRALAFARTARFQFLEGLAANRCATIHSRLGEHEQARRYYGDVLAIAHGTGNTQLEAMALNGTAETHAALDAAGEAIRTHGQALHAATGGARYEEARAHAGLGDTYARRGEHAEAAGHWRAALRIYRELDSPAAERVAANLARAPAS